MGFEHTNVAALFDARDVIRLVVVSAVLAAVPPFVFRRNAPSQRMFLVLVLPSLVCLPWLFAGFDYQLPIGLSQSVGWDLSLAMPNSVVFLVLAVGLLGVVRELFKARQSLMALSQLPVLTDPELMTLAHSARDALGLARVPVFRIVPRGFPTPHLSAAPFASSMAGGCIVLPQGYSNFEKAALRAVIMHELVHVARRDDRWALGMRLLACWYWFLPWLRGMEQRYLDVMEHSCDDRAADLFGPRLHYMHGVVAAVVAEQPKPVSPQTTNRLESAASLTKTALTADVHPFVERVRRFGQRQEFDRDAARVVAYFGMALILGLTVSAIQPVLKVESNELRIATAGLSLAPAGFAEDPNSAVRMQSLPQIHVGIPQVLNTRSAAASSTQLTPIVPVRPIYPGLALLRSIEGEVVVEYTIAADGTLVTPRIRRSEPLGIFDAATLRALDRTHFPQHHARPPSLPSFARAGPSLGELRVRQRFRYALTTDI